mmetsp:Transcript_29185/g.63771  ORF Transcript_29185/g.63771 Transcript_29185/m.63771 type:complete len:381 (-) Transcript_29185:195-1337(-)
MILLLPLHLELLPLHLHLRLPLSLDDGLLLLPKLRLAMQLQQASLFPENLLLLFPPQEFLVDQAYGVVGLFPSCALGDLGTLQDGGGEVPLEVELPLGHLRGLCRRHPYMRGRHVTRRGACLTLIGKLVDLLHLLCRLYKPRHRPRHLMHCICGTVHSFLQLGMRGGLHGRVPSVPCCLHKGVHYPGSVPQGAHALHGRLDVRLALSRILPRFYLHLTVGLHALAELSGQGKLWQECELRRLPAFGNLRSFLLCCLVGGAGPNKSFIFDLLIRRLRFELLLAQLIHRRVEREEAATCGRRGLRFLLLRQRCVPAHKQLVVLLGARLRRVPPSSFLLEADPHVPEHARRWHLLGTWQCRGQLHAIHCFCLARWRACSDTGC